jgi:hypothetical protein
MRIRSLFHKGGRLKHPHEWDHDTAASVASIEVVTRNLGDGTVEYVRTIKLWDEGKALEIPALRPACRRGASDSRSWASTRRTWRSETPSSRAMARVAFWGSAARAAMIWRSANRSTGESLKPGPAAQSRAGLRPGLGFQDRSGALDPSCTHRARATDACLSDFVTELRDRSRPGAREVAPGACHRSRSARRGHVRTPRRLRA